jgi:hypothetical protein
VGAALANKKYGRLSIDIQCDGDLNYAPGVLWTAAHHKDSPADDHAQQSRLSRESETYGLYGEGSDQRPE